MLKAPRMPRTLTRREIRAAVYESCPKLSRADATRIFEAVFEELSDALLRGEQVQLRSFGSFSLREKGERIGRNPKTGVAAIISARKVISFSASPTLIERVNGAPAESLRD